MTFIDASAEKPSTFQIVLFSINAIAFVLCSFVSFYRGQTRRHYRSTFPVWFLFPFACLISAVENIVLATSGYYIEEDRDDTTFLQIVFVLQTCQVPIILVTIFELTYLVHKRRSVSFCGMYFDEGRRVNSIITTRFKSFVFRNALRILGVFMLTTGIFINLDLLYRSDKDNYTLTGRTGWSNLWSQKQWTTSHTLVFISLLPTAILFVVAFFQSVALWRYGNERSMNVHPTFFTYWYFPFFGNLALVGGQLFGKKWYPFTSNFGFLILVISLLLLQLEIDKDINATAEFSDFLNQVKKKGDFISVRHVDDADGIGDEIRGEEA